MLDPTSVIPEKLKERLVDRLVEWFAAIAERFGGEKIADRIRQVSSTAELHRSEEKAMSAGIQRFIRDYRREDEDLVDSIQKDSSFGAGEAVQDALVQLVKRPGAWLGEEREIVLRHFETVLPSRVNRERVDKAISFLLRCIAEEVWSLPGASEIRDAYSTGFQELSTEAQLRQLALTQEQLAATRQLSALVEQNRLAAPAPPIVIAQQRPYHNLPQPTYTQFVGREAELAWLRQRLSPDDRAWQIAITGIGGAGKSALALAIAHEYRQRYDELQPEQRFEAIIWVSAKGEVLTARGREPANLPGQVLHVLEDVFTAIGRVLEREEITRAQPHEQWALVEKALKRQRVLLIMDNLESVKDDRISAFLRNLPSPTKAIIASRESVDVAAVKPLTGLSWEDAERLINEEAKVREVSLTPQQRRRIFELTSGLPLPIGLGIARMADGESTAAVERWLGDATGELPEYCIKGQIERLQDRHTDAWTVLAACAMFDRETGASREALGDIADISLADRDIALRHLHRFYLINRTDRDRFWLLPMVQRYAGVESLRNPRTVGIVDRWLSWLVRYATAHGGPSENDPEQMRQLGYEYANLRAAIYWCRDHRLFDHLIALCDGVWHYPYRQALFGDLEDLLSIWLEAARQLQNVPAEGHALLQQGRVHWVKGDVQEALNCLDRAEDILEQGTDYLDLAEAWQTRASILKEQGLFDDSVRLGLQIIAMGRREGMTDVEMLGLQRLAVAETSRGDLDRALQWCDEGIALAGDSVSRMVGPILHTKGQILLCQGHYVEAEPLLDRSLAINRHFGSRRDIARSMSMLARVYSATGRPDAANDAAEQARTLADESGFYFLRKEVAHTLAILGRTDAVPADSL